MSGVPHPRLDIERCVTLRMVACQKCILIASGKLRIEISCKCFCGITCLSEMIRRCINSIFPLFQFPHARVISLPKCIPACLEVIRSSEDRRRHWLFLSSQLPHWFVIGSTSVFAKSILISGCSWVVVGSRTSQGNGPIKQRGSEEK